MEYDVYLRIKSEDVHKLGYILEVEDNFVNMRKYENGLLRILVPADMLQELLEFLETVRKHVDFEVVECRENDGRI
ncbi:MULTISPECIES: DUF4911 domain-containing protein [Pseudothermotoga]|jgi:hypothetical protein|uniref:DUF4911 domain-containing protein n=1 Tax=Pseudothermotoga TaxID=1643951 RepID=UPI00040925B5|nr:MULTISPECIES: DUF4911 domain-containing protein [Pseudothermotoga]KUK21493.1 MAG: Uncharacterized protein XD56_0581 [Pseudothermotoga lettingae]HBT25302.1 DUF4911 domain-containing protein [Pseudothermotoga sp.]